MSSVLFTFGRKLWRIFFFGDNPNFYDERKKGRFVANDATVAGDDDDDDDGDGDGNDRDGDNDNDRDGNDDDGRQNEDEMHPKIKKAANNL